MATQMVETSSSPITRTPAAVDAHWRKALPVLRGAGVTLRELRATDAATLLPLLTTEEVTRFISPPPTTVEGFARFIQWAQREREAGRYACFAVVPDGYDSAVGLFQIRQLDRRSVPPNGALRSARHSGVPACSRLARSS
jgi:RimJ/RimL family protein N-acetyltransferase